MRTGERSRHQCAVLLTLTLAATLVAGIASPAAAVSGATQVNVSSLGALTDLGLGVDTLGTADLQVFPSFPQPLLFFPITGLGTGGEILHDGSGIRLFASAVPSLYVDLENFVIGATQLTGDVMSSTGVDVMGAPIFDYQACSPGAPCEGLDLTMTISGIGLNLTSTAAGVLTDVFGAPDLTGAQIGVANSTIVPEPGTALLLGGGLAGLTYVGRPRRS